MSEDRELLELAARAEGRTLGRWFEDFREQGYMVPGLDAIWNPLEDDGDALRLAAALDLTICTNGQGPYVADGTLKILAAAPPCRAGEEMPAIRRCIVRAAAEIGRTMP